MDKKVLVPIAQGTEEMEAIVVIDLLRRAGINVKIAGENEIITCSSGVKIIPDILIDNIFENEEYDAIVLPGGLYGTKNLSDNRHLERLLQIHKQRGGIICAICAAPTILDMQSLINENTSLTSHPSVKDQLSKYRYFEEKVVIDNNIITSRGAGTAIEFALKLIEVLVGEDTSKRVEKEIVLSQ